MGFLDRLFIGKSVELGVIQEGKRVLGKTKKTALMAERRGRRNFVIKHSSWFLLGGFVNYEAYSPEEAAKLKDALSRYEKIHSRREGEEA